MPYKLNAITSKLDVVQDIDSVVDGPAISTDNAVARFDGTTGKLLQNSGTTISDANVLSTGSLTLTTDLAVTEGGTGNSSSLAYSVICGGVTDSGAYQAVASLGASGEVLTSNGAGSLPSWQAVAGTGDVTAAANLTDNALIRGDGGAKGIQDSGILIDDSDAMTSVSQLGVGTASPQDTLQVVGNFCLDHTAAEDDDHAIEILCDSAGFGDVKAIDIVYTSGAVAAGEDEEAILVNIDETASVGGEIAGYEVLSTAEGSATLHGYTTGININPILHNSGTFGDADSILNIAVDVTAALASGGAGNISVFVNDDDTVTYGDAAQFNEVEFILDTPASGAGIAPTWEYSTGGSSFAAFSPADGTNGLRNTGAVLWIAADLAGWVTNASGNFEIRHTRTRNSLATTPILDEVQISSTTEYIWDKDGAVRVKNIAATDNTAYAVLCGGTTTSNPFQSVASVGSSGQALVSNGAAALPTFQSISETLVWSEITDATKTMVVNEGYIGNRGTAITFTLPTTAAVGDRVAIMNLGAGLPVIAQNAGESIKVVDATTTTGVGGSLTATEQYASIELICMVADTTWGARQITGNWTVV